MSRSRSSSSRSVRVRSRGTAGLVALAGSAAGLTASPSFGLAEAIFQLCPSGITGVTCPFYEGGGPIADLFLSDPVITGRRTVIGFIDGLFPLSSHEALVDNLGDSRVTIEIQAGLLGDGEPGNQAHTNLRTVTTGVIHAALGNGLPREPVPLARGVAYEATAYVAAVANQVVFGDLYSPNLPGIASSMFIMADPAIAAQFGISQTADVILTNLSIVGDFEGEGYLARVHDGIASMYDMTIIAPAGDGAEGPFPPNDPDGQFRTVGSPAASFGTMGVAAWATPEMSDDQTYAQAAPFSGRGLVDARDWRSMDNDAPSGFTVEEEERMGVEISAPGEKLRLATAEGEGAYSRDVEFPDPDDPSAMLGSEGTAFAAGITAGSVALLQDLYKALLDEAPELFPPNSPPRLPNTVVRGLLINSAEESTLWTNQGNQGQGGADVEPITNQPLDSTEGGGIISLNRLFQSFQGKEALPPLPGQVATMDSPLTPRDVPLFRLPPNSGGRGRSIFADCAPDLGGDGDPDLGGGGGGGDGEIPDGPFIPDPDINPGGINPNIPPPPDTQFITFAIPVTGIGWDIGRIAQGQLDYAITEPVTSNGRFKATLVWNRTETFAVPNIAAGQPLNIAAAERELELEDLNLEVYTGDGGGNPRALIGASLNQWGTIEHVFLPIPPGGGSGTQYIMRVRWNITRYDVYDNLFNGDVAFGLAWRYDFVGEPDDVPIASYANPADVNVDGEVNFADINLVLAAWGTNNDAADINNNGLVDFFDLNVVLSSLNN